MRIPVKPLRNPPYRCLYEVARYAVALPLAALLLQSCGGGGGGGSAVGPAPLPPTLADVLGSWRTMPQPAGLAVTPSGNAVTSAQLVFDQSGPYRRSAISVPVSTTQLRTVQIDVSGTLADCTTAEVATTDRANVLGLAVCVPAGNLGNPAACNLAAATTPLATGTISGLLVSQNGGLFAASAQIERGSAGDWSLAHDGLGTMVTLDRDLQPVRGLRFTGLGLGNFTPPQPLLLPGTRTFVTAGVRQSDGALWHFVGSNAGATTRSFAIAAPVPISVNGASSDLLALTSGAYAVRHYIPGATGSGNYLCVFGADHEPRCLVEDGSTSDLSFVAEAGAQTFLSQPIVTAAQQWQAVRLQVRPQWQAPFSLRGQFDESGAVFLSDASGGTVVAATNSAWAPRFAVLLPGLEWSVQALSPQCVLVANEIVDPTGLLFALLDRATGQVRSSYRMPFGLSNTVMARFANDGASFLMALQGATSTLVAVPSTAAPRAFTVTSPAKLNSLFDFAHDPANDLFAVPVVDNRAIFATASNLATAGAQLGCLAPVNLDVMPLSVLETSFLCTVSAVPSLPLTQSAATAPQTLALQQAPFGIRVLAADNLPPRTCP